MHARKPHHRQGLVDRRRPVAANDNVPPAALARKHRRLWEWLHNDPVAFALSLLCMGALATAGYTIAATLAVHWAH